MTATILDGKTIANQIRQEIKVEVSDFVASTGVVPCLAAILVGDDSASLRPKQRDRMRESGDHERAPSLARGNVDGRVAGIASDAECERYDSWYSGAIAATKTY